MNSQKRNSILVIDNELESPESNRKEDYVKVLATGFELHFVENPLQFDEFNLREFDAFVVDWDLGDWRYKGEMMRFSDVLDLIPKRRPVILVSNKFGTKEKKALLSQTIQDALERHKEIVHIIEWSAFERQIGSIKDKDALTAASSMVEYAIKNYYQRNDSVDIAIVCAVREEYEAVVALLEEKKSKQISTMSVIKGYIPAKSGYKIQVAVVKLKENEMGNISTAFVSSILLNHFEMKYLCMIGVCAGRKSEGVKIGDIILVSESLTYDTGKLTDNDFIPEVKHSSGAESVLSLADQDPDKSNALKSIRDDLLDDFEIGYIPKLVIGPIGCGNMVISKTDYVDDISEKVSNRKLVGIEMESYALLKSQSVFENGVKTFVIKSVMDLGEKKTDSYKAYASNVAAKYFEYLTKNVLF